MGLNDCVTVLDKYLQDLSQGRVKDQWRGERKSGYKYGNREWIIWQYFLMHAEGLWVRGIVREHRQRKWWTTQNNETQGNNKVRIAMQHFLINAKEYSVTRRVREEWKWDWRNNQNSEYEKDDNGWMTVHYFFISAVAFWVGGIVREDRKGGHTGTIMTTKEIAGND